MGIRTRSILGKDYHFEVREDPGYDPTVTDDIVIREVWDQDTYLISPLHFLGGGVVMDIGANIGSFSIYAIACGATHVHAFEPDPENLEKLRANIALNKMEGRITVHPVAVADKPGKVDLVSGQGASLIMGSKQLCHPVDGVAVTSVDSVSFGGALGMTKHKGEFAVLKIDCEGSEYLLLPKATKDELARFKLIRMEFHGTTKQHYGAMLAALSPVFNMNLFGAFDHGGALYGERMW